MPRVMRPESLGQRLPLQVFMFMPPRVDMGFCEFQRSGAMATSPAHSTAPLASAIQCRREFALAPIHCFDERESYPPFLMLLLIQSGFGMGKTFQYYYSFKTNILPGVEVEMKINCERTGMILRGDEDDLELDMVTAAQLGIFTKNHYIV